MKKQKVRWIPSHAQASVDNKKLAMSYNAIYVPLISCVKSRWGCTHWWTVLPKCDVEISGNMPSNYILKQFSFSSDGFAAMVFLWRFYLSADFLWKKAARGCFLEAKVRISKMLWHGTFYNIEKWSLDSLSRIRDLHLACVVQTGLLLIYQQDFAWVLDWIPEVGTYALKNLNRRRK